MESLIKQTRSRFAGTRQDNKEEESSSTTERKTQPFKEREKSQSWIGRQFSRQMSSDYDFNGAYYPAAVAAAAYAIQSLEESKPKDRKETTYGPDKSLNKMKSKVEDTGVLNEPLKSSLKPSDEASRKSFKDPDNKTSTRKEPSLKKRTSFADIDETIINKPENLALKKAPEKVAPSMKKPPTVADNQLNKTDSKITEMTVPNPNRPTAQPVETRKQSATKLGRGDSQADAWEKEEMASIKERYDKLMATTDNWGTKKKRKAKRKIERTEAELDKRRAKAIQSHQNEITRIEEIAWQARLQAGDNQRKEEFKVKEKANKIRLTGKIPATCWCF